MEINFKKIVLLCCFFSLSNQMDAIKSNLKERLNQAQFNSTKVELKKPSEPKIEAKPINTEEVQKVIDKAIEEAQAVETKNTKSTLSLWERFKKNIFEHKEKYLGALGAIGTTAIALVAYSLVSTKKNLKDAQDEVKTLKESKQAS